MSAPAEGGYGYEILRRRKGEPARWSYVGCIWAESQEDALRQARLRHYRRAVRLCGQRQTSADGHASAKHRRINGI